MSYSNTEIQVENKTTFKQLVKKIPHEKLFNSCRFVKKNTSQGKKFMAKKITDAKDRFSDDKSSFVVHKVLHLTNEGWIDVAEEYPVQKKDPFVKKQVDSCKKYIGKQISDAKKIIVGPKKTFEVHSVVHLADGYRVDVRYEHPKQRYTEYIANQDKQQQQQQQDLDDDDNDCFSGKQSTVTPQTTLRSSPQSTLSRHTSSKGVQHFGTDDETTTTTTTTSSGNNTKKTRYQRSRKAHEKRQRAIQERKRIVIDMLYNNIVSYLSDPDAYDEKYRFKFEF
ncbi:unnamed protein product [Ambrosiozyma monospora]|uniref:Unnamed protein product n=1 Tax=Ambrosiozyma monospora TaxID=43982 RepID=A0A9W7DIG1_AMBMO|nr:unnamed protein product [Ambrosiozyma monospora]